MSIREFLATDYRRLVAGLTLLAGSQAAEDAVQEALARAWERSERGEHIESLKAWVAVVATNLVRSAFRRVLFERRAGQRLAPDGPERASPSSHDRVDVVRAVRALPTQQREVVVLYYFVDLPVTDIARAIHMKEGTVKVVLHRARKALAQALGEQFLDEGSSVAGLG
jgi:RNA polymerase sigma factor (sigma-70 family)